MEKLEVVKKEKRPQQSLKCSIGGFAPILKSTPRI